MPGGAKKFLSARQARALIATVSPRDLAGKTRRRLAVELIGELEAIDKKTGPDKELTELVAARGSTLMDLHGIGRPAPPGCSPTSATSTGSPAATASPPGTAPPRSTRPPATTTGTGSPVPGTGASTGPCTSWPSCSCGTRPGAAPIYAAPGRRDAVHDGHARPETAAVRRRLRQHARRQKRAKRVREDNRGRL